MALPMSEKPDAGQADNSVARDEAPETGAALILVRGDDEPALVARVRGGDARAYEALFRAYSDPLVRFAERYLKDEGVAEDLVEDVFFRIWERRAEIGRAHV